MNKNKQFLTVFAPSWVSNFIGVSIGIIAAAGVVILNQYQGSQLRQEIFEAHSKTAGHAQQTTYHTITTNIANNHILGTAPLFLIWASVGLIVYYFTMAIVRMFGNAFELRQQLDYVNVSRQRLLKEALLQLTIRVAAILLWFIFIKLSVDVIAPYALAAANSGAQSFSVVNALYVSLCVLVLFADVYVHTVLLRLIVLKPRLF